MLNLFLDDTFTFTKRLSDKINGVAGEAVSKIPELETGSLSGRGLVTSKVGAVGQ
jgi:hypothetical protein